MTEPRETFEEYTARLLRHIADSHGISYAELTADWPPPPLCAWCDGPLAEAKDAFCATCAGSLTVAEVTR